MTIALLFFDVRNVEDTRSKQGWISSQEGVFCLQGKLWQQFGVEENHSRFWAVWTATWAGIILVHWSTLVMWLDCRFLNTEIEGSNPGTSMLYSWARHFICISSVDSDVKWVPGGNTLVKGVQCYELFGGIALKNHAFLLTYGLNLFV